jgi:hypothetical protein
VREHAAALLTYRILFLTVSASCAASSSCRWVVHHPAQCPSHFAEGRTSCLVRGRVGWGAYPRAVVELRSLVAVAGLSVPYLHCARLSPTARLAEVHLASHG